MKGFKNRLFPILMLILCLFAYSGCGEPSEDDSIPSHGLDSSSDASWIGSECTNACQQVTGALSSTENATTNYTNNYVTGSNGGSCTVNGSIERVNTNSGSSATDARTISITITFDKWIISQGSDDSVTVSGSIVYYEYEYYYTDGYYNSSVNNLSVEGSGVNYESINTDEYNIRYGELSDTLTINAGNADGSTVVSGYIINSKGEQYNF